MRHLLDFPAPPVVSHPKLLNVSHLVNSSNSSPHNSTSLYTTTPNFNISIAIILIALVGALFFMAAFATCVRRCTENDGAGRRYSGLDAALIANLPLVAFKTKQCKEDATECPVCLNEFEENDRLRLLPKCNHIFHQECIDMWLFSHTTCPLCRHSLLEVGLEKGQSPDGAEQRTEVVISIHGCHVRIIDRETADANAPPRGQTRFRVLPMYAHVFEPFSRTNSRNARGLRRSNSTGHSLVRIVQPLQFSDALSPRRLPVEVPVPLNPTDFHRCRSYAGLSDCNVPELRYVNASKIDEHKESSSSSSKGLWGNFSFRNPFDAKRNSGDVS